MSKTVILTCTTTRQPRQNPLSPVLGTFELAVEHNQYYKRWTPRKGNASKHPWKPISATEADALTLYLTHNNPQETADLSKSVIDDLDLHRRLKIMAAEQGLSIKALTKRLIRQGIVAPDLATELDDFMNADEYDRGNETALRRARAAIAAYYAARHTACGRP